MVCLRESLSLADSIEDKCKLIWQHYENRKLTNSFEPNWIHAGYELVYKYLQGEKLDSKSMQLVQEIVNSHSLEDGFSVPAFPEKPSGPMRIIHDGWKAGTPSWVFMGRSLTPESVVPLKNDWIAVQRTLPSSVYELIDSDQAPPTLWIAYNLNNQMGLTGTNVIGPAIYFDELISVVEQGIDKEPLR